MSKPLRLSIGAAAWLIAVSLSVFSAIASETVAGNTSGVEHVIEITGFKFVPEKVEVRPGDTITWINRDIAPHTATSNDGSWDTGILELNESKTLTVGKHMTPAYFCQFHRGMTAIVNLSKQSE